MQRLFRVMLPLWWSLSASGCTDSTNTLTSNYALFAESAHDRRIIELTEDDYGQVVVPCEIVSYDHDGNFIVAAQRVEFSCLPLAVPGNPDSGRLNPTGLVVGDTYYWIVDDSFKKVYGPFDAAAFRRAKEGLNVPKELDVGRNEVE